MWAKISMKSKNFPKSTKKGRTRGAFHKAGFTCRKNNRSRAFVRTPFHTPCPARYSVLHLLGVLSGGNEPPFTQGSLWFVRSESLSAFPDKHCFCGHKSGAPREQKLGYNVIKALKSSVSLIGSKQRMLFKH